MALNIKKCTNCGEDLMLHPSTGKWVRKWVHRYNMNVKCPNGTGVAQLPLGDGIPGGEQKVKASGEGLSKMLKELAKQSEEKAQPQGKQQGKGKGKGDGDQKQQEQQSPPPEGLPEWMLKAASDINDEWRKRIENRDFMLTDEEAALTIHKHVDPDAAAKQREADDGAEKNIANALLSVMNCLYALPPSVSAEVRKTVQCVKCGEQGTTTSISCTDENPHKWGVIMPAPKIAEEKAPPKQVPDSVTRRGVATFYPGNKFAAIQLVRQKMGWGLKEAKDYVDTVFNELMAEEKIPF